MSHNLGRVVRSYQMKERSLPVWIKGGTIPVRSSVLLHNGTAGKDGRTQA